MDNLTLGDVSWADALLYSDKALNQMKSDATVGTFATFDQLYKEHIEGLMLANDALNADDNLQADQNVGKVRFETVFNKPGDPDTAAVVGDGTTQRVNDVESSTVAVNSGDGQDVPSQSLQSGGSFYMYFNVGDGI